MRKLIIDENHETTQMTSTLDDETENKTGPKGKKLRREAKSVACAQSRQRKSERPVRH